MESEDYPFFQGLVYLLENDVSTLGYELTFSTEVGVNIDYFSIITRIWPHVVVPKYVLQVFFSLFPQIKKAETLQDTMNTKKTWCVFFACI